ncbi:MAG: 3-deoxy-manno-octulosonate cytidylyltransferase [Planctomycetota bacterium]
MIPARHGSRRLPGKPLLSATGRPLILHVVERARSARTVDRVVVATDDERIADAVRDGGGEAMLSTAAHDCGTSRVAEVAESFPDETYFVNLQGDEPEIDPADIDLLVDVLESSGAPVATLAAPIAHAADLADPAIVKVVTNGDGDALYFSRAPIPFDRDGEGAFLPLHHLGIYAFRRDALLRFRELGASPLERTEKLEQLRALEDGMRIRVATVKAAPPGIDTMDAYEAFVARWKSKA